MNGWTLHISHFSILLRQLSSGATGGTDMLFTDAKEGNLCFLNDLLHLEQTQTEYSLSQIKLLDSLLCVGRSSGSLVSMNDPPLL